MYPHEIFPHGHDDVRTQINTLMWALDEKFVSHLKKLLYSLIVCLPCTCVQGY
jgi:hypothetical protein